MKTKIKDYLQLIIAFSVAIAVFLFIRPFIQSLLNKFIASMTFSQIGRFFIIIIGFGAGEISSSCLHHLFYTYLYKKGNRKGERG